MRIFPFMTEKPIPTSVHVLALRKFSRVLSENRVGSCSIWSWCNSCRVGRGYETHHRSMRSRWVFVPQPSLREIGHRYMQSAVGWAEVTRPTSLSVIAAVSAYNAAFGLRRILSTPVESGHAQLSLSFVFTYFAIAFFMFAQGSDLAAPSAS